MRHCFLENWVIETGIDAVRNDWTMQAGQRSLCRDDTDDRDGMVHGWTDGAVPAGGPEMRGES